MNGPPGRKVSLTALAGHESIKRTMAVLRLPLGPGFYDTDGFGVYRLEIGRWTS